MTRQATISRKAPSSVTQDYTELRRLGIEMLEDLVTDLWVDFGPSDPGITIMEAVAYAVTDVAYRIALPFDDLIAPEPGAKEDQAFFTPAEILPCEPLTHLDWRKLIIDRVDGVRNCWLEPVVKTVYVDRLDQVQDYSETGLTDPASYDIKGLYNIWVEGEDDNITDQTIKQNVEELFHRHRALCEDLQEIRALPKLGVTLCVDIELKPEANANETFAELIYRVEEYLSPSLPRYSLDEMLEMGHSVESIFTGPRMTTGFILDEDLLDSEPRRVIYGSDLIKEMMCVPGVLAVEKLEMNYANKQMRLDEGERWELPLSSKFKPRFNLDRSKFCFFKERLPIMPDVESDVFKRFLQSHRHRSPHSTDTPTDLTVPYGRHRTVSDYRTVQYEFPQTYGLAGKGLPAGASTERKAQAQQLQGYLLLFDQLIADLLAQLAHTRDLLAIGTADQAATTTYFSQAVAGLENLQALLKFEDTNAYTDALTKAHKHFDDLNGICRRNAVLDHLLARFGEHFNQYAMLFEKLGARGYVDRNPEEILQDKIKFLEDYPVSSRRRGSGFDLNGPAWDTRENVPGLQQRAGQLLGFADISRTNITDAEKEGMFVIENLLLRPPPDGDVGFISTCFDADDDIPMDPYSFRVHVIVPSYAGRFGAERDHDVMGFRRFVEKTVREEIPAHVMPKICFVDKDALRDLEKRYRIWLQRRASGNTSPDALNSAHKALLKALSGLHSEYPARKLHKPRNEGDPRPIILNRTHLGEPDDDP